MIEKAPYIDIHTHKKVDDQLTIKSIGVHPYDAENSAPLSTDMIKGEIEAIGEIGLDFICSVDKEIQKEIFTKQLSLSEQLSLPVIIHAVRSFDVCMAMLNDYNLKAVIFHGFIGSQQQATAAFKREGYYLSFGHRCFHSPKTIEVLTHAPLNRIFFETDMHDSSIEQIYHLSLEYRTESLEQIKEQLYNNYINIFKKQ